MLILLSGCVALPATGTPTTVPAASAGAEAGSSREAVRAKLVISAPSTPASVPVILAARRMSETPEWGGSAEVMIFANHTQANAQFLRGDTDILVTGLSVGVDLFGNGAPIQVINSYVAGMTYLVTHGVKVERFADLPGAQVYVPFEGSPIEETTRFLAEQEGLVWKTDIRPIYSPFGSSVELLKQGKAAAVALPEPFVSLVEGQPDIHVSFSYRARWDSATGGSQGYPQVTPFVKRDWAAVHPDVIARFNDEIVVALQSIQQDPALAVERTKGLLGLDGEVLLSSLRRTDFAFISSDALAEAIQGYYRTIGKPLDESFNTFFYRGPQ